MQSTYNDDKILHGFKRFVYNEELFLHGTSSYKQYLKSSNITTFCYLLSIICVFMQH
jgi:hypothetical protein